MMKMDKRLLQRMAAKVKPSPYLLRQERERLKLRNERARAREWAKREQQQATEEHEFARSFARSGFSTEAEYIDYLYDQQEAAEAAAEQAQAEQAAAVAAFLGEHGAADAQAQPDAVDLALELSRRHVGGPPAALVDLVMEIGMATNAEDAMAWALSKPGKALTAALSSLGWTRRRENGGNRRFRWWPPVHHAGGKPTEGKPTSPLEREHT